MAKSRIRVREEHAKDPAKMLIKLGRDLRAEDPIKTTKTVMSTLKDAKAVRVLQCIGRFASGEAALSAVSTLGELRALRELVYLGKYGSDEVATASIVILDDLEAGRELGHILSHCNKDFGYPDLKKTRQIISSLVRIKAVLPLERITRYCTFPDEVNLLLDAALDELRSEAEALR